MKWRLDADAAGKWARLLVAVAVADGEPPPEPCARGVLTGRERDVLTLLAAGCTVVGAAARLGVSRRSATIYVGRARRKLAARGTAGTVAAALRAGLIPFPERAG